MFSGLTATKPEELTRKSYRHLAVTVTQKYALGRGKKNVSTSFPTAEKSRRPRMRIELEALMCNPNLE